MQKEACLQEKGLDLYLLQSGGEGISFSEVEAYSQMALKVLKKFFFSGYLKPIVDHFDLDNITINVELCNEEKIQELNRDYRQKDKVTDVLSFPTQDDLRNKEADIFIPELELGDIFICTEVCVKQAHEFNISTADEFVHLLIHGVLHLCGFDHEISEKEEQLMEMLEKQLLDEISQIKKGE